MLDIFNSSRATAGCFSGKAVDRKGFAALVEGEEILVAESVGQVVGFVSVWVADRFIHHLYVLPQMQNKRIGSALLQACEAKYGHPLSLKCDICNLQAQRFYKSKGWSPQEAGIGEDGLWERLYSPRA
ncbi:MAG: GNAT family N-acetyltransferase [Betaproteobacteria bacterium]|nr:GNAT family N-acetyltransferase [Betaproteobacteria bacterium]